MREKNKFKKLSGDEYIIWNNLEYTICNRFLYQLPQFVSGIMITQFRKMGQTVLFTMTRKAHFGSQGPEGLVR